MSELHGHDLTSGAKPESATRSGPERKKSDRTRRIVAVILCCTMVTLLVTLSAAADTIYVDACDPGPGEYNTLTSAVAAAIAGDTIVIQGGFYPETLDIYKELTITASGGSAVVGGEYSVGSEEVCVPLRVTRGVVCCHCGEDPTLCSRDYEALCPLGSCGVVDGIPHVNAKVYYPSDGMQMACGGPFPAVVYIHGYRSSSWNACEDWDLGETYEDYLQTEGILRRLAASGMIVIAFDASCGYTGEGRGSFALNALAYLVDKSQESGSFLENAANRRRIGFAGHSFGGAGAMYAARHVDDPLFGLLGLDGVEVHAVALLASALPEFSASEVGVPVLSVFGTNDVLDGSDDEPVVIYREALPPKHLVVVEGANHFGYTDGICVDVDDASRVGGVGGPEAHARQQRTARNYVHAFFSYYLQDNASAEDYLIQNDEPPTCDPGLPPNCGEPRRFFDDLEALNVEVSVCSCEP